MGDCCRCNDFRFFTALRYAQNDREGVLRCVRNGRGRGRCAQNDGEGVLGSGWQKGSVRNGRMGGAFGMTE